MPILKDPQFVEFRRYILDDHYAWKCGAHESAVHLFVQLHRCARNASGYVHIKGGIPEMRPDFIGAMDGESTAEQRLRNASDWMGNAADRAIANLPERERVAIKHCMLPQRLRLERDDVLAGRIGVEARTLYRDRDRALERMYLHVCEQAREEEKAVG